MKAQGSAEYLVVVSAMLAVFLIFYAASMGQNMNLFQAQDSAGGMREAYALSAAMNYVHLAGHGASLNFTQRAGNLSISDFAVESARGHAIAQAPLLNADSNASSVGRGEIGISNDGGVIGIGQ